MSRNTWDAVLASTPLNTTAARVTSKGFQYQVTAKFSEQSWDAPPPLVRITRKLTANASFTDFTGRRVGRLTVIGLAADGVWVCRCSCGRYVGRRAKGIKKNSAEAMCNHCDYARKLRENASGDAARERASHNAPWHAALTEEGAGK